MKLAQQAPLPYAFWQSFFLVDYPLLASFLGTDCRSAGGGHLVRVLSRKHPACRGPLEWWHQLRWRDRIIFWRLAAPKCFGWWTGLPARDTRI